MKNSFLQTSQEHLHEYLLRITKATLPLTAEQMLYRPHEKSLSITNILKHLNGNVTQWILSGLGHEKDERNRASEFLDEAVGKEILLPQISLTVTNACSIIESIAVADLDKPIVIQGFETTPLKAVYHVVEHFSWHTGQVTYISKMVLGVDHGIAFYSEEQLNAAKNK